MKDFKRPQKDFQSPLRLSILTAFFFSSLSFLAATHPAKAQSPVCSDENFRLYKGATLCAVSKPDVNVFCMGKCPATHSCRREVFHGTGDDCTGSCNNPSLQSVYCCKCFAEKLGPGDECAPSPTLKWGKCRVMSADPPPGWYCDEACGGSRCKKEYAGQWETCQLLGRTYACNCYDFAIQPPRGYGGIPENMRCEGEIPAWLAGGAAKSYAGVASGLGCIPTDFWDISSWFLWIALGIGGGFAVLMIIISGYGILTSQGDPEKLQEAKGTLTAAISGLLFIILSVTIFRLITRTLFSG